ncbi:hypothetical protein [Halobellus marinus]|uniref:hypothetical protein n=1 Tax=Halobellus TaxID=1073986 RepID=UPI0028AD4A7F|nr:hypothetical protein [Halobellus sp. DFY28]
MSNQSLPDNEFDWGPPPSKSDGNRRGWIVATVIILTVTTGMLVFTIGGASAHTDFAANDVAITSNGGNVKSLTVTPTGDVHYEGLETAPSSVDVVVEIKRSSSSSWDTLDQKSLSASGQEGEVGYNFSTIDVLSESSLTRADFKSSDGQTSTTDLDIRVTATLVGAGSNGNDVTAAATETFTVSVENIPAGGNVGGKANTNGN